MTKKILFISNTANFSKFNRPFMRWFKEQDWQVDYVSAGEENVFDCDRHYVIPIKRNPFNIKNIKSYKELKKLLSQNCYNIIHCHTPMGGVLGRLAARNKKTKIIYTAHGFHFYKGAPLFNWLVYYPVEKYLANFTDVLITINTEDYNVAKQKFLSCKNIFRLNGVGVDLDKFRQRDEETRRNLRKSFGINDADFVIVYVAEFIPRKNHKSLIKSIFTLNQKIENLKVIFAGIGPLLDKYKQQVKTMGVSETVRFLGYRSDIDKLCNVADIGVSTSKQEGLPIGVVEYLVSGLPIVCSKIRGHVDIVKNGENGLLFDLGEPAQLINSITALYDNKNLRSEIGQKNIKIRENYSRATAISKMAEIYTQYM